MPWTIDDVDSHKKDLTPKQKKKWVKIANTVLKGCLRDTKDSKKCEVMAIKIANEKSIQSKRVL